jgi:hypothetical protein
VLVGVHLALFRPKIEGAGYIEIHIWGWVVGVWQNVPPPPRGGGWVPPGERLPPPEGVGGSPPAKGYHPPPKGVGGWGPPPKPWTGD